MAQIDHDNQILTRFGLGIQEHGVTECDTRSGSFRFESLFCYGSFLGDLGSLAYSQPNLFHRGFVKIK